MSAHGRGGQRALVLAHSALAAHVSCLCVLVVVVDVDVYVVSRHDQVIKLKVAHEGTLADGTRRLQQRGWRG